MLLEWSVQCDCGKYFGDVALAPWSWKTRLFGKKCPHCGQHYSVTQLQALSDKQRQK